MGQGNTEIEKLKPWEASPEPRGVDTPRMQGGANAMNAWKFFQKRVARFWSNGFDADRRLTG